MDSVLFTNVRCFKNQEPQRLGKLTFLVGENSTGKSTFLALVRLAWDVAYGHRPLDFNEPPFALGAYDQIAHYRGGKAGRMKDFTIGLIDHQRSGEEIHYSARFREINAQPALAQQSLRVDDVDLCLNVDQAELTVELKVPGAMHSARVPADRFGMSRDELQGRVDWQLLFYVMNQDLMGAGTKPKPPESRELLAGFRRLTGEIRRRQIERPLAIAPVRTKAKRTYDPVRDTPDPEGGHIPMVLARIAHGHKDHWAKLQRDLDRFGTSSGLFQGIEIKTLGKGGSAAVFQIQVKVSGPAANLVDIGYGVSQVLPIVVDALSAPRGATLLVQQPEVHLHPRAQAELGTFLASTAGATGVRFVLETHSDHLIDRVRMEVRDRKLDPDDVVILYFERRDLEVEIHRISLDRQGNLLDVPEGYRTFFLTEESRLLGIEV